MPNEWIHHPWDAPPGALRAAGVELGTNYPRPIVEIGAARERLQASLAEMWERDAAMKAAQANGLEEGLGETVEVVGTGGPLHERMDVHRVIVHRDVDVSSNSSRRDQLVPEIVPTQFHLQAHASIMNQSAPMVEDVEEVADTVPYMSQRRNALVNIYGNYADGINGQVPLDRTPTNWPTVTAVDYDLDSTAESTSVAGRADSGGGTVPVWSQSLSARSQVQVREGLVPVVPEVRRGAGPSRRHLHASVQRVNLEAMTSNKVRILYHFFFPMWIAIIIVLSLANFFQGPIAIQVFLCMFFWSVWIQRGPGWWDLLVRVCVRSRVFVGHLEILQIGDLCLSMVQTSSLSV